MLLMDFPTVSSRFGEISPAWYHGISMTTQIRKPRSVFTSLDTISCIWACRNHDFRMGRVLPIRFLIVSPWHVAIGTRGWTIALKYFNRLVQRTWVLQCSSCSSPIQHRQIASVPRRLTRELSRKLANDLGCNVDTLIYAVFLVIEPHSSLPCFYSQPSAAGSDPP